MNLFITAALASCLCLSVAATAQDNGSLTSSDKNPVVLIKTNLGPIVIRLDAERAPVTVANFLSYVEDGFYSGTIFHRVISNFMIQGGGFTVNFARKSTKLPIDNEADNGLKNKRGTIAMARTNVDIHSATCQFFINLVDNEMLDFKDTTLQGYGYAVFGEVIMGMEVVDSIAAIPTGAEDVPTKQIVIEKVMLNK